LECKHNGGAGDKWDDGNKWNEWVGCIVGKCGNEWSVGKHGHIGLIGWVCDEWECGNEWNKWVCGFVRDKWSVIHFRKLRDDGS
jgi:hypothetical protein